MARSLGIAQATNLNLDVCVATAQIKLLDDPPSDAPADWCAGVDCGDGSDNAGVQLTAVGITTLLAVLLAAFTATVGL